MSSIVVGLVRRQAGANPRKPRQAKLAEQGPASSPTRKPDRVRRSLRWPRTGNDSRRRRHADRAKNPQPAIFRLLGELPGRDRGGLGHCSRTFGNFSLVAARPEGRHFRNGGRWYLGAAPSKRSVQRIRIKTKLSDLLMPGNKSAWPEVCARLNRLLGGWAAYFSHGSLAPAYQAVDRHVYDRVCDFLRKRHKTPGRGTKQFPREHVYGERGVLQLNRVRKVSPSCAL